MKITENQIIELGFQLVKKYKHNQFTTNRYCKGVLEVEFSYNNENLVSVDLTITELNCKPTTLEEIKKLTPILGCVYS